MSQQPAQTARLGFLDAVRGIAALYVMIFHARELLFEGFHVGGAPGLMEPFSRLFAYATISFSFAHQAVILFFVLSGLVIHLRFARDLHRAPHEAHLEVSRFYFRRIRRLGPALALAVILTLVLDLIGTAQGYSVYRQATPYTDVNAIMFNDHDVLRGLQYFFFGAGLQTWGTNTPLWSLRLEIWFYLLYPLLWFAAKHRVVISTTLVISGFAAALLLHGGSTIVGAVLLGLPAWWMGALLAEVVVGRIRVPLQWVRWLTGLLVFLPPLQLSPLAVAMPGPVLDLLWAAGFVGLLAWLLKDRERISGWRVWSWLRPLGDCSYTLYVIHFPIFVLMSGWLMAQSDGGSLPRHPLWIVVGSVIALMAAYALHWIVEKPFASSPSTRVQAQPGGI